MKFLLDGLTVYFPYTYIYPEQYAYMLSLKRSLDAKGPCVLEMPSGTGKTISLLALIISYQLAHPTVNKLIYCSRTVPEIEKTLEELRRLIAYRDAEMQKEGVTPPKFLGLALSSRRNLCIHPRVREYREDARAVDAKCRDLTASWIRRRAGKIPASKDERGASSSQSLTATATAAAAASTEPIETCSFFENYESGGGRDALLTGVYSLDDLREFGEKRGWCPYFLARHLLPFANVVVFSYQYLVNPKIAHHITRELSNDSIVVFDEAHNIDTVCIDALSVNISRGTLEGSTKNLSKLTNLINQTKLVDAQKLHAEYRRLVSGLARSEAVAIGSNNAPLDPVLPQDVIEEAVPGNIRRAEHFIGLLRRFVEYLKTRLRISYPISERPLSFLQLCFNATQIEPRVLRFCSARLASLLVTLEVASMDQFSPLQHVTDFATLVATYQKGFLLIIEPDENAPPTAAGGTATATAVLHFACLDASLAMKAILTRFRSVVVTSGTLSPLNIYPKLLAFTPVVSERFPMTLTRPVICPLIATRGSDQVTISTKYELRNDPAVVRNFGALLAELSACVPDGIVCFFTSYQYLELIVALWNEMGLLNIILKHKLLFVETTDAAESSVALFNYRRACDNGRGAVFFCVARGKVSEGIDFDNHYGRCVIVFGVPYVYTESRILKARLEYLRDNYQIRENEFLTFDAMRTASQCVGRVIRGKSDYGITIFADKRYARQDKKSKLPQWIAQFLTPAHINLSTDEAVAMAREFLKEMAQPRSQDELLGTALWSIEHLLRQKTSRPAQDEGAAGVNDPMQI